MHAATKLTRHRVQSKWGGHIKYATSLGEVRLRHGACAAAAAADGGSWSRRKGGGGGKGSRPLKGQMAARRAAAVHVGIVALRGKADSDDGDYEYPDAPPTHEIGVPQSWVGR